MKRLSVFVVFLASFIISSSASALSPVVSIAQLGGAGSGTSQQEFFQIYNNSSEDIDVTNWCIVSGETTNLACFVPPSQNVKLFLESKRSILIGSSQFLAANPAVTLNYTYTTSNIPATNGSLKIVDAHTTVIDRLGWGTGTAEGSPMAGNLAGGKVYKRISSDNVTLQDTNNNAVDFTISDMPPQLSGDGIYEQEMIIDVCTNIDGVQPIVPEGFIQNGNNCDPIDVCPNIAGPQTEIPIGFMQDSGGNCFEDICDNLEGLQKILPNGYYNSGVDCHIIELELSELLPNVSGYDTGKEYIEVVNPTPYTTSLAGYSLQLGTKIVALADVTIGGNQYIALSDIQTGIILPNTSATVKLIGPDGIVLDESIAYQGPQDDMAWTLIDGVWQYTDILTPNAENIPLQEPGVGGGDDNTSSLTPCATNQYRSPDTNRCRLIVSSAQTPCDADEERNPATGRCRSIFSTSSLTPCQPGQTRNPETNRCRSTVSTASADLVPCKAGEERNPTTNRCRKITTSSSLKPCPTGEERNPETNRCRKSAASAVLANVRDNPAPRTSDGFGWILAGGAMVSLGGYGAWEWRREIVSGISKVLALFGKRPPEL